MKTFNEFLIEETEPKGKALRHLTHLEDHILYGGHEGVSTADHHLDSVHNALTGKSTKVHISGKFDGAPSVVYGTHPETNKFFVASKSAFNKTPKINYTPEDIEKNHGHAPGLVEKLKSALEHLPKITPNHGVYQGDLMHTEGDHNTDKHKTSITPNTITYSAPNGSAEAENMKKKLGVVVHTQYKGGGKSLQGMSAEPLDAKTRAKFKQHPDVNNIDPTTEINPHNYTPEDQKEYLNHMENARRTYLKIKPDAFEKLEGHGPAIEGHVNDMVRKQGIPSLEGYTQHLTDRHNKDIEKTKNANTITKKLQNHAAVLKHINDNSDHFKNVLDLHNHFQAAKNVLTRVLGKNSNFSHSVDGVDVGPEGSVIFDKKGNASKFVNRSDFSRMNFLKGQYQKKQAEN